MTDTPTASGESHPPAETREPSTPSTQASAASEKPLNIGLFDTKDPNAWFFRAEMMFRIRNTTSERRKAELVMECLPPACWNVIAKFFEEHEGSPTYQQVKEELLEHWDTKPAARAKQFFGYLGSTAGDTNISTMYHTLENLTTIPKSTTRAKSPLNIIMEMTLQLYPQEVRAQLPAYMDMGIKEFLKKADNILAAYTPPTPAVTAAASTSSDTDAEVSSADITAPARMKSVVVKPDRQKIKKQGKELCYYHKRFGPKGYRCQSPCDWTPKNA